MSGLACLPDEVLKLVMKHIPFKDRLTSCCLVNSRLHAAAVAVTYELDLSFGRSSSRYRHPECCFEWMKSYGEHLTRLCLSDCSQTLQQLPCPNLVELWLGWGCNVQLGPTANAPGVLQGCTKLTKLEVRATLCDVVSAREGAVVASLSSLTHLQHLWWAPWYHRCALSSATLPRMQHLTYLDSHSLSEENLLQLGALTSLQQWVLQGTYNDITVGPSRVPGLTLPASLTRIMWLSPVEAGLLSLVPTELQDLWIECDISSPAEGPGSFLSGMARLQHLTRLHVQPQWDLELEWPDAGPAYSALTASSNLVTLQLHNLRLPDDCIWQHVFPATHKLPHLTSLEIDDYCSWGMLPPPSAWNAADVSDFVSCCPNMCSIATIILEHGTHVSELQKLKGLTELCVYYCIGSVAAFEQSLKGLAAVTQLLRLHVELDSQDLSTASLLPLTRLTALTKLECYGPYKDLGTIHMNLEDSSAQAGSAPDVWLQLLLRCAAEPGCASSILRSLAHQLAERRTTSAQQLAEQRALTAQQLAELRGLVSQQQQQVTAQQQMIAGQQQQIAMQEQRLSTQQLSAAEQGARIAALERQLQFSRSEQCVSE